MSYLLVSIRDHTHGVEFYILGETVHDCAYPSTSRQRTITHVGGRQN